MENKNKKDIYKVTEIFNENGKNIKVIMEDIFKTYCLEQIEKKDSK